LATNRISLYTFRDITTLRDIRFHLTESHVPAHRLGWDTSGFNLRSPRNVSTEMSNVSQCNIRSMERRQNYSHLLLRHDEETDMTGYRILILIAAILITGCEALVFVGTTAVN
jgi:hypothetical protein